MTKRFSFILLILLFSFSVQAQVYKCENDAGEIKFSDEPCSKGEDSERLDWLKGATSTYKKKIKRKSARATQAQKTAKKAKKADEAYVLLSLLTTTQLELKTASLKSSLKDQVTTGPELLLSDGLTIDLLKVDKILMAYQSSTRKLQARFIMDDGYEELKILDKPFPKLSGEAKIGRFEKSLEDIKQIQFFNSKKLLKRADKKSLEEHPIAKKSTLASKPELSQKNSTIEKTSIVQTDVPVIELDLSHQVASVPAKKLTKNPKVKVVSQKKLIKEIPKADVLVDLVNKTQFVLKKTGMSSSKGGKQSRGQHFFISDKQQIPYDSIKTIKVRPTSKKQLIVAVELKSKEIKMEVMSPPFTRIIGKSDSGPFNHSLAEIISISFKR
ncbi:MAG: DUF4124 domain-containing protein [Gammaproteobacteria bacterium]|nr:DUF4124 domain-containing protein [Gammaproteobacteria bacterium]